ncbi:hypothetical protein EJ07DRAFT_154835 [Lizonia empirigonia]|nr:hypothetical protein EJ07DRAFT_154835 [Lizonia empirigonia]
MSSNSISTTAPASEKSSISTTFNEFRPGRTTHTTITGRTAADKDIRKQPASVRHALLCGFLIPIFIDGYQISMIPLTLLQATSSRASELLYNGAIHLAPDTEPSGVTTLVQHLVDIASSDPPPLRLPNNLPIFESLALCQASQRLGLTKHTAHIFRATALYFARRAPQYPEIDALQHFAASHPRLHKIMLRKLAALVRADAIPDPDDFAAFCADRPALNAAIVHIMERSAAKQHRKRRGREGARVYAQAGQWQVASKAHEVAMQEAYVAKTRALDAARVLSGAERMWYVGELGRQPPRGC